MCHTPSLLDIAYVRYPGTRKTIFLWVSRCCNFIFHSLWHFIAKCVWYVTKCDSYFNTNFNKSLLQKESDVLLQIATLITKWDVYYKTRRYKQLAKNQLGFLSLLNTGKTWRKNRYLCTFVVSGDRKNILNFTWYFFRRDHQSF